MKALLLLLCFAAPAYADLYRWIDPESGSVKLSRMSSQGELRSWARPSLSYPKS